MKLVALLTTVAAIALAAPAAASAAQFEGTVVSVNRDNRTLPPARLRARHGPHQGDERAHASSASPASARCARA